VKDYLKLHFISGNFDEKDKAKMQFKTLTLAFVGVAIVSGAMVERQNSQHGKFVCAIPSAIIASEQS
jgi:hypothetical protein